MADRREYYKEYYKKNKNTEKYRTKIKNSRERYYASHPWVKFYYNAYRRCNYENHSNFSSYGGKGIKFMLTMEEVKQLWYKYEAYELIQPSIDRIDSNGHYTIDNTRFIELYDNISRKGQICKKCQKSL